MYLYVEALTGLTIRLKVEPDDLIKSIKYKIMVCEDLPIDEQHLIFQETDLNDEKTIRDYKICTGSTIRLIMKMRGGPQSPDMTYEDVFADLDHSTTNSLSDYLAIMLFENGDYKFVPVLGLEKQNPKLKQTKDDLNDEDIYFTADNSQSEHKIAILKLKMDYAKLNKKISSFQSQNNGKSQGSTLKDHDQHVQNKQMHHILCRSMSLDSRSTGLIPDVSKLFSSSTNHNTLTSSRSPSLGIYRTMSVLDTVRVRKTSSTLPCLQDKDKNRETLQKYSQSFEHNPSNAKLTGRNILYPRQKLPPLNESEELKKSGIIRRRCASCSKRLTLTNEFTCRCGGLFCPKHRYPEEHQCSFDFKFDGQLELIKSNPVVKASKITKI